MSKYIKKNGDAYKTTPAQRKATKNYYERNKHNNKDLYKKRAKTIVLKKFNAMEINELIKKMEDLKMNRLEEMDELIEILGEKELLEAIVRASSDEAMQGVFNYIKRTYDLKEIEE